jgi:hypothetical protein
LVQPDDLSWVFTLLSAREPSFVAKFLLGAFLLTSILVFVNRVNTDDVTRFAVFTFTAPSGDSEMVLGSRPWHLPYAAPVYLEFAAARRYFDIIAWLSSSLCHFISMSRN